jgi:pilus assembly protein CpaE
MAARPQTVIPFTRVSATVDSLEPQASPLLIPAPIEAAPKLAAGRLPLMAFVDAESERVLQESSVLAPFGRNYLIMRGGIVKAVEYLGVQRSPHRLIIDVSGVELPLSHMQALADVCEPGVTVIAIGDHNDVGLYRDLTEIGVADYIVKPLTRERLARALEPRTDRGELGRVTLKLGKVVTLIGARGGVGATTLAVNLGWHFANRQRRRVALVDLDLQHGDCSLLLNVKPTAGFREALANPFRIDHLLLERIMAAHGERLFVLGSEEPLTDNVQVSVEAIEKLFSVLRSQFHYVIVDVPRTPTPAYRCALDLADLRLVVADQTMRSVRDTVRLNALLNGNGGDHRTMLVVNRGGEAGRSGVSLKDMQAVLHVQPKSVIPFLPALLTDAANIGEVVSAGRSKFGDAVAALASELSGRPAQRRRWWKAKK